MFKNALVLILVAALAIILPACGSSSNSSSGTTTVVEASVFNGELLFNITTYDVTTREIKTSTTDTTTITISIATDGAITIHLGNGGLFGTGTLRGSSFEVWGSIPEIDCPLFISSKIDGTITGTTIAGTLSGGSKCDVGGSFNTSTTGTYTATQSSGPAL